MFVQRINDDLLLRMLKVSEDKELFTLIDDNRLYLQTWLDWVQEMKTPEDCRHFITNAFEAYANKESLTAGIFYKDTLVGITGLNSIDPKNKTGTLGYWLGENFQGRGIMTVAVKGIINHSFKDLQLNRLQLFAAVDNMPSRGIPERLNFLKEGTVREYEWIHGKPLDQVVYSLLKKEWVEQ